MKRPGLLLTRADIVAGLRKEIWIYRNSYREPDGTIHNENVRVTIAILKAAAKIIGRSMK